MCRGHNFLGWIQDYLIELLLEIRIKFLSLQSLSFDFGILYLESYFVNNHLFGHLFDVGILRGYNILRRLLSD